PVIHYYTDGLTSHNIQLIAISVPDNCTDDTTINVITTVGLNDIKSSGFSISPNPAHNKILISLPAAINADRLSVKDIMGKQLINYRNKQSGDLSLDVSELSPGLY